MKGAVGYVGLLLIGVAMVSLAYVLIRNEGWRATTGGRRRRGLQLALGAVAALVGLGLVAVGLLGLFTR